MAMQKPLAFALLRRHSRLALPLAALLVAACMPDSSAGKGDRHLTVYGFSVLKEVMEKAIFPGFKEQWKRQHGEELQITSSFAGSEIVTNQILQGVDADVAVLSIERDAERLRDGGAVTGDWHLSPHHGVVNTTPFVILVRKGNPKGIRDFADLAKEGVQIIHPDPVSSGGAQWSLLALYGSELIRSEKDGGRRDEAAAQARLAAIWKNVIASPASARDARTQFEQGFGDALVTYELDGIQLVASGAAELIVPRSTIFSEHVAVAVDRNLSDTERQVATEFLAYLWSPEAQAKFVQHHFHSVTDEGLNAAHKEFSKIELPFTVADLGGWARAYPDVIEGIWKARIQKSN
jgi:sulfate/thiosulfate transport system substrate-binding protein